MHKLAVLWCWLELMTVNEGDLWAIYLGGMTKRANAFVMQTFSNFVPCQTLDNCHTTILAQSLIVRQKKDSCEGTFNKYSQDVFQVQLLVLRWAGSAAAHSSRAGEQSSDRGRPVDLHRARSCLSESWAGKLLDFYIISNISKIPYFVFDDQADSWAGSVL